jgi:hypothetical protein
MIPSRALLGSAVARRVPAGAAAVAVVALVAGCTGSGLSAELAILADRADRLAEHLEVEDGCAAEREGAELVALARDAAAIGEIDRATADQVAEVVSEVTEAVPCDDVTPQERDDAGGTEGRGPVEEADDGEEETAEEGPSGPDGQGPPGRNRGRGNR